MNHVLLTSLGDGDRLPILGGSTVRPFSLIAEGDGRGGRLPSGVGGSDPVQPPPAVAASC